MTGLGLVLYSITLIQACVQLQRRILATLRRDVERASLSAANTRSDTRAELRAATAAGCGASPARAQERRRLRRANTSRQAARNAPSAYW